MAGIIYEKIKFELLTLVLGIFFIGGCVEFGWSDDMDFSNPTPQTTCSDEDFEGEPKHFVFVIRENVWGCLVTNDYGHVVVIDYFANDRNEARSCALEEIEDPNGFLFEVYDHSRIRGRYFVVIDYATCDLGTDDPPECIQVTRSAIFPESARLCVEKDYYSSTGNVHIIDVTDLVLNQYGGVDLGVWDAQCPEGCYQ